MYAIIGTEPHDGRKATTEGGEEIEVFGIACYSAITPQHHSIEIGIILSPLLHRSTASTEVSHLLLHHGFSLGYRRVEWRCNERNEASKRAAERLGFVKEGVLRRQQVVKGRGRDTAVYGMLGAEWGFVRGALEKWLHKGNFEGGRQQRKLEDFRREVAREGKEGECLIIGEIPRLKDDEAGYAPKGKGPTSHAHTPQEAGEA